MGCCGLQRLSARACIARSTQFALAALAILLATFARDLASAAAAPSPYASRPEFAALYSELEKLDAVREGASRPKSVLYVFFDANCFYCHLTWKALQPYEKAGLQVRWVPVAYQQASSVGRAAAIMEARDRVAAMRENETKYDAGHYDGGIKPLVQVREDLRTRLTANTKLMNRFGAPGTPALVWKDNEGSIRFKVGMVRLSEIPAITALPAQVISDRELSAFR